MASEAETANSSGVTCVLPRCVAEFALFMWSN